MRVGGSESRIGSLPGLWAELGERRVERDVSLDPNLNLPAEALLGELGHRQRAGLVQRRDEDVKKVVVRRGDQRGELRVRKGKLFRRSEARALQAKTGVVSKP